MKVVHFVTISGKPEVAPPVAISFRLGMHALRSALLRTNQVLRVLEGAESQLEGPNQSARGIMW